MSRDRIIATGKAKLFLTSRRGIAPIGFRLKHGMRLDDGRWIYELDKELDGTTPARCQHKVGIFKLC